MGLPEAIRHYSIEEYCDLEFQAVCRSEYYAGEIFALAGGSFRHSLICSGVNSELRARLKGGRCAPYESNLRVKVVPTGLVTYPDASVFCDKPEPDPSDKNKHTGTNPTFLVEVLSKSTEGYDRGKKAENYRQIPSLRGYMLVSQSEPHVELYEVLGDGFWFLTEASGMEGCIRVSCLGIVLSLAEIYDRVDFTEPEQ